MKTVFKMSADVFFPHPRNLRVFPKKCPLEDRKQNIKKIKQTEKGFGWGFGEHD